MKVGAGFDYFAVDALNVEVMELYGQTSRVV